MSRFIRNLCIVLIFVFTQYIILYASSLSDLINNQMEVSSSESISGINSESQNNNSSSNVKNNVSGSSGSNNSKKSLNIDNDFINNIPNYDTRTYRFEFPDGTTGYGTKSDFDRIMKERYTFGFIEIGGNYYYKNTDGTFKIGWHQVDDDWYYFDKESSILVTNELRDIDGKVYYFNENGEMERNRKININGTDIYIDKDGYCSQNQPDGFITKEEMRDQFVANDDNFVNARIVGNADGVTHITVSSIGQLYIAYPTLYLSTGEVFNEFGKNMERYIVSQMPNLCVEISNKLKEDNNDPYTPFTIKKYEITNVQDGVIYFKGESPILTINRQERKQRGFNIIFNFAYIISTGIVNANYNIS